MKKFLSLTLSIMMLLSLAPFVMADSEEPVVISEWEWEWKEDDVMPEYHEEKGWILSIETLFFVPDMGEALLPGTIIVDNESVEIDWIHHEELEDEAKDALEVELDENEHLFLAQLPDSHELHEEAEPLHVRIAVETVADLNELIGADLAGLPEGAVIASAGTIIG